MPALGCAGGFAAVRHLLSTLMRALCRHDRGGCTHSPVLADVAGLHELPLWRGGPRLLAMPTLCGPQDFGCRLADCAASRPQRPASGLETFWAKGAPELPRLQVSVAAWNCNMQVSVCAPSTVLPTCHQSTSCAGVMCIVSGAGFLWSIGLLILGFRHQIGRLFVNDRHVVQARLPH